MIAVSNDETNFPHKLLLPDRQVSRLLRAFAKNLSANIKLFKSHLLKIRQSGGLLNGILGPLLKTGLLLMKSVLIPLAKSVLMQLRLMASTSTKDAAI